MTPSPARDDEHQRVSVSNLEINRMRENSEEQMCSVAESALASNGHTDAAPSGKHTPGPWVSFERVTASSVYSKGNDGSLLATIYSYSHGMPGRPDREERAANARLVAAAPDLLEACIGMVAGEDALLAELVAEGKNPAVYGMPFPLVDAMRAAIAKAEGRS